MVLESAAFEVADRRPSSEVPEVIPEDCQWNDMLRGESRPWVSRAVRSWEVAVLSLVAWFGVYTCARVVRSGCHLPEEAEATKAPHTGARRNNQTLSASAAKQLRLCAALLMGKCHRLNFVLEWVTPTWLQHPALVWLTRTHSWDEEATERCWCLALDSSMRAHPTQPGPQQSKRYRQYHGAVAGALCPAATQICQACKEGHRH